jgi:FhuF 2Fe-2S C-terminal domain
MTDKPQPTEAPDSARHLAELSTLGGYFALPAATPAQWQHLSTLFTDTVITDHVDRTREAIASSAACPAEQIPIRMAASSFQLGVAARLLSPAIGGALSLGAVPVLDAQTLRWAPSGGHAPLFAVAATTWNPVRSTTSAQVIATSVLPVLTGLGDRLNALVALSPRITLGNLTSAANGAVTVLALSRPHLEYAGRALVRALLAIEPLTATGSFVGGRFRRRSCCLYYQAPESGLCGDCVLTQNPGRSSAT